MVSNAKYILIFFLNIGLEGFTLNNQSNMTYIKLKLSEKGKKIRNDYLGNVIAAVVSRFLHVFVIVQHWESFLINIMSFILLHYIVVFFFIREIRVCHKKILAK